MKFDHFFAPGQIGAMEVKNRLIVSPLLTEYANEDGIDAAYRAAPEL